MSRLKKVVSFVACFLAATLVLGAFGYKSVRAADSTDAYIFEDAPSVNGGKIRNESGTQDIDELAYCLEIMKQGPGASVDYSRSLLSDTSYSDDVKSKLMVVLMDREGIRNKLDELYDDGNGVKAAGLYWTRSGSDEYVYQNLIWLIVSPDDFLVNKTGPYGYKGVEKKVTGRDDYDYTNGDSMWNTVFDPLLKYIEAESSNYPVGKGAGQYDASYYSPNKEVQHLLGRGFVNPTPKGSLRITKTIEGDVSDSDLTELKFTITASNGKTYGPYTLGKDFTYDSDKDLYYKDLNDIDATLTYTVEETDYKVDGTTVKVSYEIGGTESGSGSVANDISLTKDETTTVDFTDSYKEETTTTTSNSTTPTTTSEGSETSSDDSTTTTPATSGDDTTTTPAKTGDDTTTTSDSESTTTTDSTETGKDGSETTTTGSSSENTATTVTGTSENTNSDSPKATPTTVPTKSTSGMTNSSAETTATPTPTGSTSKTTSSTPDRSETTSSITKTGESSSHTVAAAMVCIFAAGALLVIRSRKFKAE